MLKNDNYIPDVIIPIAKGGIIPAGMLSQFYPKVQIYTVQTVSYSELDKPNKDVKVYIPESIGKDLKNKNKILIIDDIFDTGRTIKELVKVLKENDIKYNNLTIATLFFRDSTEDQPDYFTYAIKEGIWLKFPWEMKI
jgi:hypoxanthine phosphoribosyltransferase